ncbi:AbrB family transcriptional regulator [Halalkalibacter kiskunsagensis]|uniref:AbrB family transcriptional regulator n=1 Tax=Halalkalibacter kiskunsagensis TaxID=1548599 RepID=A0ABV6KDX4_9BACI
MNITNMYRMFETSLLGLLGGCLFYLLDFPLPWVLGAMTFVMLWQGFTKRESYWPNAIKNSGFIILGTYFGLYFTAETFFIVGPNFISYVFLTIILITISIFISSTVTNWINVDKITSVFGSIPGGLTEMTLASENLNAESSLVVIFQTVRLLTVLFIVPSAIVYFFSGSAGNIGGILASQSMVYGGWNYLWFTLPAITGILLQNKIPAGLVIGPLAITAILNIGSVDLASIPHFLLIAGQISVGIGLGKNISFADLKKGGKYCLVYFAIALTLIIISFGLGAVLANFTTLNLATAILSVAPGGLIEMVLTASMVGADPAIVSALQLTRILLIVIFVPPFLKWYFRKKVEQTAA